MKTIKLNEYLYNQWVCEVNNDRKSKGLGAWRCDATENMFLFLCAVLTCNYYKHKTGYANRSRNKQINSNPFLLCNGKLIYEINYSDMPILLSTAAHNILISNGGREKLEKMGLVIQRQLSRNSEYQNQFYYELTEKGKKLLPDEIEWMSLNLDQSSKIKTYLLAQNGLTENTYRRLIKGLMEFEFNLPPQSIFIQRHLKDYEDDEKDYKRAPAEMLEIMFQQMQHFNIGTEDSLIFQCSSDVSTWGGRFYAIPTYIKSFCRQYLRHRVTKRSLIELDIQNSQFHMLNAVLKQFFPDDYDRQFDNDLKSGACFYRIVGRIVFNKPEISKSQRNVIKQEMFHAFFKGRFEITSRTSEQEAMVLRVINQKYPKLVALVGRLQKRKIPYFYDRALPYYYNRLKRGSKQHKKVLAFNEYRKVSFSATLKETEIMSALWNVLYKNDIHFITVHDAILVEPNDLTAVKDVFCQTLKKYLGYIPVIREELLSLPVANEVKPSTTTIPMQPE